MKPPLDLRLLQAFILLVETGSFSETSRRVGRTQPAVTLQMQRLEKTIGSQLFNTVGRKLVLTPDGELLLGYARTIMGLQDEVKARLAAPKLNGQVIIGTPDLYAAYLLPSVLSEFGGAYPNIEVELRCALSSRCMASLQRNEIDLALVTGMPASRRATSSPRSRWCGSAATGGPCTRKTRCRSPCCRPATFFAIWRSPGSRRSAANGASSVSARASAGCRPPCSAASP